MSPTEQNGPSLPSPDYRTKSQTDEKEHFHFLPQLQAKRADFLTVMLTGTLPQRRTFLSPEEDIPEPQGPRDDDVTKSESNSEASQKSTERSQDAAPSTLMAEDQKGPREPASAADADPDLEDASKTLVLFSPGDTRKSPSAGDHNLEGELATPSAITPRQDRLLIGEAMQLESSDTGRLSPALRSDLRASTPIAPASPPFTKVERTFVHIAETSHLNVMSSNGQSVKESDRELMAILAMRETFVEGSSHEKTEIVERCDVLPGLSVKASEQSIPVKPPENDDIQQIVDQPLIVFTKSFDSVPEAMSPTQDSIDVLKEHKKEPLSSDGEPGQLETNKEEPLITTKPRIRSRIPVLISEDSGSDQSSSLSGRAHLQKRARQLDLARLVVEKEQGRWMRRRMLSGTSSSLSSGDDERRRASETLSTTGSEEDTNTSDESVVRRSCRLKPTEEQGLKEWRSRIPRPVTPIKRPSGGIFTAAPSPLSLPATSLETPSTSNRLQKVGSSNVNVQRKSKPSSSKPASSFSPRPSPGPAQPSASPRMPLRIIFGTRRSLSTSHCRTDSPSPQRVCPSRQPLSVRTATALILRPRTTAAIQRSASQEVTTQSSSSTPTPAKVKPRAAGPVKGKHSSGEKLGAASTGDKTGAAR